MAEVRVETASGTEPEATLRVLSLVDVEKLREAIFKSRLSRQTVNSAVAEMIPNEPGLASELLLEIPTRLLVRAGLASNRGMILLGFLVGILFFSSTKQIESRVDVRSIAETVSNNDTTSVVIVTVTTVIAILILFRLLGIAWYLLRFHGYRLTCTGDDLRISCGLFTRVSATVPRQRIQFISIYRNLIMRWMKLASIRIETAGGSGKEGEDAAKTVSSRWFIPVLPESRVPELIDQLRPGLCWNEEQFDWKSISPKAPVRLSRLAVIGSIFDRRCRISLSRDHGDGCLESPRCQCLCFWRSRKAFQNATHARRLALSIEVVSSPKRQASRSLKKSRRFVSTNPPSIGDGKWLRSVSIQPPPVPLITASILTICQTSSPRMNLKKSSNSRQSNCLYTVRRFVWNGTPPATQLLKLQCLYLRLPAAVSLSTGPLILPACDEVKTNPQPAPAVDTNRDSRHPPFLSDGGSNRDPEIRPTRFACSSGSGD